MEHKKKTIIASGILLLIIISVASYAQQPYWLTCLEDIVKRGSTEKPLCLDETRGLRL